MNTVRVDLSLEQLQQALRQLPPQEKITLWRMLDADLDRKGIARRFASVVKSIHKSHASLPEEDVMADAVKAVRAVRRAKNRP